MYQANFVRGGLFWGTIMLANPALAGNGFNLIGFGTESIGMGGADLAVARDTSALNTNPAGLTQIEGQRFEVTSIVGIALNVRHKDQFDNDRFVANTPVFFGNIGYAHTLNKYPVTVGMGLFFQGGPGFEYENLHTAFGTTDDLVSLFEIARLNSGLAYQVNDRLSLGVSLMASYTTIEQKIFPETSFSDSAAPEQAFLGFRLKPTEALGFGAKLGLQYKLNDQFTLGIAYTSQIALDFDAAKAEFNMTALGLGKVNYSDVQMEGLNTPQEFGIGIAYHPNERWLASAELTWLDWSSAIKRSTLRASNPDNPAAAATLNLINDFDWRDQYVLALGLSYAVNPDWVLRAGYNYGNNPVPIDKISPLLPQSTRHHLTTGFAYRFSDTWQMEGALEYQASNEVRYVNPALPFGDNAAEELEAVVVYFTLRRQW